MTNVLGHIYEKNQDPLVRKSIGQYYTPDYIIKYILKNTVSKVNIVNEPYIKVIDPSCGAGYFLLEAYDILKKKFIKNISTLKNKYKNEVFILEKEGKEEKILGKDYWNKENIHYHLLKNCIYGADKDKFAVKLTISSLMNKESKSDFKDLNILACDSLVRWENKYNWKQLKVQLENSNKNDSLKEFDLIYNDNKNQVKKEKIGKKLAKSLVNLGEFWSNKFHICVGNPPYIGHKEIDKKYKAWLLEEYKHVFKDKSDISFCFFSRILDILHSEGICSIITSRYFMESPSGRRLRMFLKEETKLIEILDFYGGDIFKNVGIATAVYFFGKPKNLNNRINIIKLKEDNYKFNNSIVLEELIKENIFEKFKVKQKQLESTRWILIPDELYSIYKKIKAKGKVELKNVVNSFQGIITGCDKAFVLSKTEIIENGIEENLLKKWIKNKSIRKYNILENDLYLIYSDLINEPEEYPNAIDFINKESKRLKNRREYKNGAREWYELQWGREIDLFQQPKIIFPYKSKTNRFAIDYNNLFFSADVYGLIIKDKYKEKISLEYLIGLLNSKVYEFYFKVFAKKMSKGIYDYYPNALLDLNIITDTIIDRIKNRVISIMDLINKNPNSNIKVEEKIFTLQNQIDSIIMDYLKITSKEKKIIEKFIL